MKYVLFDNTAHERLLPFTHTRPVADIRCGIFTMRERWELCLEANTGSFTTGYLQKAFPVDRSNPGNDGSGGDYVFINGAVFANSTLAAGIKTLLPGETLMTGNTVIATRIPEACENIAKFLDEAARTTPNVDGDICVIKNIWDIFSLNDSAIREDFKLTTRDRKSAPLPEDITVIGKENVFLEEGANVYAGCIINASVGPVYVGKGAEILEGTMIRGPIAVCDGAVVKMGAKIYGSTTIGPGCKVGGEINNVVFFANSNKSHDGYLGNAVIGEWCNLGADTNCSNLKNNYDEVKIWDEAANKSIKTGLTFCGLFMGDHSKCSINTMFNTGTIVGVSCNIFGGGFPEKFVRSFSWGGSEGTVNYDFNRAMETAARMMSRRGRKLSAAEMDMYRYIYDNHK